jgi:hypothetical protein
MKISEIRQQYPQYKDLSDRELADALHDKFYPDMELGDFYERVGLTKKGIGAAVGKGIESLVSSGRTAIGALTGSAEEAAEAGLKRGEDIGTRYAEQVSLEKVKKAYEKDGVLSAAGEAISQIPAALAEQAPNLAATLGTARAGAALGSFAGPAGTVIGGLAGAALPSLIQQFGGNIERQATEQKARGEPIKIDTTAAGAAALPQAALDVAGTFIPLGGRLVSKLTGIPEKALLGKSAAQVTKLADEKLLATLAKGTATGAIAEIPTEIAQQMMERAQAGLSLSDADALKEYGETAYQVGLLAPIGAAGRLSDRAGARGEVIVQKQEEARKQREEEAKTAKAEADKLEAYKQTPEYLNEIQQKYTDYQKQFDDLTAKAKVKTDPNDFAGIEAKREARKQLAELKQSDDFKNLVTEYRAAAPRIAAMEQQKVAAEDQRLAGIEQEAAATPQDTQAQEYFQSPQGTLPGFEAVETTTKMPEVDTEAQYADLKNQYYNLTRALEDHQQKESDAAAKGDIAELEKLFNQRSGMETARKQAADELALVGVPVDRMAEARAISERLNKAKDQLKAMAGPGFDPAKARKLVDKIKTYEEEMSQYPGVQQDFGLKATKEQRVDTPEEWRTGMQRLQADRMAPLFASQERGAAAESFMDAIKSSDEYKRQAKVNPEIAALLRIAEPKDTSAATGVEIKRMEMKGMEPARTDQYSLFDEAPEIRSDIQSGTGALATKSRAALMAELQIASAAGNRQAKADAVAALQDLKAKEQAAKEKGAAPTASGVSGAFDTAPVAGALAGTKLPKDVAQKQAAADARELAYAKMVTLVSQYNKGRIKQDELDTARKQVVDNLIADIELNRGEPLTVPQRQIVEREANIELRELILRFGDTRDIYNKGTAKEPEMYAAQTLSGEFTNEAGQPFGYPSIESRAQGNKTFGSPYAAAMTIKEGLDQIRNQAIRGEKGTAIERTYTPEETSVEALQKDMDKAFAAPNLPAEVRTLLNRVADNFDVVKTNPSEGIETALPPSARGTVPTKLVDDISSWLHRAMVTGKSDPEMSARVTERLDQLEKAKISETQTPTRETAFGTAVKPTETAIQGELDLEGNKLKGRIFESAEAFESYLASEALQGLRSSMGIVTQTVARLTRQLAPLKTQAESIAKQLKAAQDQYDKAVAVKGADVGAANQILEATKRRLSRVEKVLDGQLRDLQIDYLKARNAFEFSAQTSEDIADAIEANTKTFSQPEYDARKEYVTAKRDLRLKMRKQLPAKAHPKQEMDSFQKGLSDYAERRKEYIRPAEERLTKATNAYRALVARNQRQSHIVSFLDKDLALQMQLQNEAALMDGLAKNLLNTKMALDEAFETQDRSRIEKAQQDIAAAEQLKTEAAAENDAKIKALTGQIADLSDSLQNIQRQIRGEEGVVAEQQKVRLATKEETQADREARDAAVRKKEQAQRESLELIPGEKISFEKRRQLMEFLDAAPANLAEQDAIIADEDSTAKQKAQAHTEISRINTRMEELTKLFSNEPEIAQAATAAIDKRITKLQKTIDAVTARSQEKGIEKKLYDSRIKELNKYKQEMKKLQAKRSAKRGIERTPVGPGAGEPLFETDTEIAERKAATTPEAGVRLAPRKIGPVVKANVTAGNVRTGELSTVEERTLPPNSRVKQAGTTRPITGTQAQRLANQDTALKRAMDRLAYLEDLQTKNDDALAVAQEAGDKDRIAKLTNNKTRIDDNIALANKELAKANKGVARISEIYRPDTLSQAAATASQGPALKQEVDTEQSAAAIMQNISTSTNNPVNKAVAERLKMLLGNTRVYLEDDLTDDNGNPVYGQAAADGSFIVLDKRYGLNEVTALHEGVHAAVERILRMPEGDLTPDQLAAKRELQALFEAAQKDGKFTNENAMTDLSEFVSEALSDGAFQQELAQRPWTLKNMWEGLKRGIMKMLGIDMPTNMLEATLAAADRIMTKVPRATAADMNLSQPKLNRPRDASLNDMVDISNKIVARQKNWSDKIKVNATGLAFETQLVDRFAGFERLSKMMDKLQGIQMMYYLRMYDQRMNFVAQSAANGALQLVEKTRADGRKEYVIESKAGASLRGVAEILKGASDELGSVDNASRTFTAYMAALRAKRVGLDKLNFSGTITQAELNRVLSTVDGNKKLKDVFERAREEYNAYNKGLVNFAVATGAMRKADAAVLLKSNDYIPFYRERNGVVEMMIGGENPIRIGNIKEQPYLKDLVGGDAPIMDFMVSSVQNTNMITDMALRNLATKNAVFELVNMDMAKITDKATSGTDVVKFKVDGEDRFAMIDTDAAGIPADILVKGMEGIPTQMPFALRALAAPASFLRKAVTATPLYAARQLFRDSLAAPLLSGADFIPVTGALRQIGSTAKGTLEARGITGGQVFTGGMEDITDIMRRIASGKSGWSDFVSKAEGISMEADALSRRAQYNSYIKQGLSEMEATYMALESMNFTKRGASPSIHMANSLIPFFNAQIQSLNVLYKGLMGKLPFNEQLRIREKLLTRGFMIAAGTMAYAAMMQDDEAYKNATPDQKYGNWFVRVPGVEEPIRLPIPFEIGYIFKALPEALYNSMVNERGGEEAVKAFRQILINTIPGGSSYGIPQAMKPAIEAGLGKSFYTGRGIMSPHEEKLLPEAQFRENTSQIAKTVGAAAGVSPIVLEQLVQGYTGTLGLAFLQAVSLPFAKSESPEKAFKRLSEMPVVGGAFQPNDAGGIINMAYDRMNEFSKVKASVDDLIVRGEKAKALELINTKAKEYEMAEVSEEFTSAMGELTQYEKAIRASNLDGEQKRARLDEIRKLKIRYAETVRGAADRIVPP